jgi:hypothetical protein
MSEHRTEAARAFDAWRRAKQRLRATMDPRDFNHFVRPMYLLVPLSDCFLLLALPRNKRIVERARRYRAKIEEAIQVEGYHFAGFTAYPSNEELLSLEQWLPFFAAPLRERYEQALAERSAEDSRDRTVTAWQ